MDCIDEIMLFDDSSLRRFIDEAGLHLIVISGRGFADCIHQRILHNLSQTEKLLYIAALKAIPPVSLREKEIGELELLAIARRIHRSGQMKAFEDVPDTDCTEFRELFYGADNFSGAVDQKPFDEFIASFSDYEAGIVSRDEVVAAAKNLFNSDITGQKRKNEKD